MTAGGRDPDAGADDPDIVAAPADPAPGRRSGGTAGDEAGPDAAGGEARPDAAAELRRLRPRMLNDRPLRSRLVALGGMLLLALAVTVAGILIGTRVKSSDLLSAGTHAPLLDVAGPGPVHTDAVAAASGRPLVVEFFDATCPTCQDVAPRVCALLAAHPDTEVVAVDANPGEDAAAVQVFARDHLTACRSSSRLHLYADPCRPAVPPPCDTSVSHRLWQVKFTPTVYVIDGTGVIVYGSHGGEAVFEGVDTAIDTARRG